MVRNMVDPQIIARKVATAPGFIYSPVRLVSVP